MHEIGIEIIVFQIEWIINAQSAVCTDQLVWNHSVSKSENSNLTFAWVLFAYLLPVSSDQEFLSDRRIVISWWVVNSIGSAATCWTVRHFFRESSSSWSSMSFWDFQILDHFNLGWTNQNWEMLNYVWPMRNFYKWLYFDQSEWRIYLGIVNLFDCTHNNQTSFFKNSISFPIWILPFQFVNTNVVKPSEHGMVTKIIF